MLNWKNIISRAVWTFLQGSLGTIVTLTIIPDDLDGWKTVAATAGAAGIAALASFVKTLITEWMNPTVNVVAPTVVVTVDPEAPVVTE